MTDLCQTETQMIPDKNQTLVIKKEIDTVDLNKLNMLLQEEDYKAKEMEKKAQKMLSHPIETKKITVGKVPNLYMQEQNIEED